jgi:hypothetical protein
MATSGNNNGFVWDAKAAEPYWRQKALEALVQSVEAAIQGTRYVFIVMNMASIVIISSCVTLYIPWIRHIPARLAANDFRVPHLNKLIWEDLYTGTLPLVGLKYSSDDLIVIGPVAVFTLTLWYVYAHRRENEAFAHLSKECFRAHQSGRVEQARYLAWSTAHYFLFTVTDTVNSLPRGIRPDKGLKLRFAATLLVFLPVLSLLLFLGETVLFVFVVPSSLSGTPQPNALPLWDSLTIHEKIEMLLRLGFAVSLGACSLWFTITAKQFEAGTLACQEQVKRIHDQIETEDASAHSASLQRDPP